MMYVVLSDVIDIIRFQMLNKFFKCLKLINHIIFYPTFRKLRWQILPAVIPFWVFPVWVVKMLKVNVEKKNQVHLLLYYLTGV